MKVTGYFDWIAFHGLLPTLNHHDMIPKASLDFGILGVTRCTGLQLKGNSFKCRVKSALGLPSEGAPCKIDVSGPRFRF